MNKFEIETRLTEEELTAKIAELEKEYKGLYAHVSGDYYELLEIVTVNTNGKGYWGGLYASTDKAGRINSTATHTTPLYEFLDGRFQQIVIEKEYKYEVEILPQSFIFNTREDAETFCKIFKTKYGNIDYMIDLTDNY